MLAVNARRSKRLTPRPALGLLYLSGLILTGAALLVAALDRVGDIPLLLAVALLFGASYLLLQQGIYVTGTDLVVQHPLQRTTIQLASVKAFTIRPYGKHPHRKALWIELLDGQHVVTNVGVGTGLLSPPIRVSFEKMVALIDVLEAHRVQASS